MVAPTHAPRTSATHAKSSEAKRSAEALFESRGVNEIREIEARTRKDIEAKKQQLRQLVGDSYRDLIDSADKIVDIANNCGTILQNVKSIQQGFSSLAYSFTTADSLLNEKRDSLTRHEELYAISSRVRYLVDTPEVIWGFLDAQQYRDAAQRYLRAQLVHQQLHNNFSHTMLAKFPLLSHQWPVVHTFKDRIIQAVSLCLSDTAILDVSRTADALAALAVLDHLDSQAALAQLLEARKAAFKQQLASQAAGSVTTSNVGVAGKLQATPSTAGEALSPQVQQVTSTLASAAAIVQTTISQVGKLFLPPSVSSNAVTAGSASDPQAQQATPQQASHHGSCLVQQLLREDDVEESELMFGGHRSIGGAGQASFSNAGDGSNSPELQDWQKTSKSVQDRLVALSSGSVERAAMHWLRDLAEEASQQGCQLLQACVTSRELVEVEAKLKHAIGTWTDEGSNSSRNYNGNSASQLKLGGSLLQGSGKENQAPEAKRFKPQLPTVLSSTFHTAGPGSSGLLLGQLSPWESVCESVLGTQLNLWSEIYQPVLLTRAKQLINDGFSGILATVQPELEQLLQQAACSAPEPAGEVQSSAWPHVQGIAGILGPPVHEGVRASSSQLSSYNTQQSSVLPWSERLGPGGLRQAKESGNKDHAAYRQGVHLIRQQLDQQLLSVLESSLLLLQPSPATAGRTESGRLQLQLSTSNSLRSMPSMAAHARYTPTGGRDAARAAELEPFIQTKCTDMACALSSMLQGMLAELGRPGAGGAGIATAEQTLLIGRLCSAIAWDSKYLGVLLGPPDAWKQAVTAASTASASSRSAALHSNKAGLAGRAAGGKLQAVTEKLRSTAVEAYAAWASWAASCLVAAYKATLQADDSLTSTVTPASWQEIVIPAGSSGAADLMASGLTLDDDMGAAMADMKFHLPACPSAAVQSLLLAGCRELRRAGYQAAPAEALQIWEWELMGACLQCLQHLLSSAAGSPTKAGGGVATGNGSSTNLSLLANASLSSRLTEKGVLQLLFDVRLVRDVLSGGRPMLRSQQGSSVAAAQGGGEALPALLDPADPAALSAVSERKKACNQLEQALQDRLDPIDWATYEHHLWSHVKKHYQRCNILYGVLTQLHKAHPDGGAAAAGKGVAGQGSSLNPLAVLPVVQRFQYLPIAVPSSAATAAGMHAAGAVGNKSRARLGSFSKLSAAVADTSSGSADLAGAYSFTDLGTGTRMAGNSAAAAAAAAADSSSFAANALSGAGAAFGASASSALGALQARLGTGSSAFGSLGTLLGDKAAEVTAMAQQRFDLGGLTDFGSALGSAAGGFGSATTGLFSSLTKGVGKK